MQVLLRPASRVVDSVKRQVWLSGRFFVVLLDREDKEVAASAEHYSWEKAVEVGRLFKGKDLATAVRWWGKMAP